MTLSIHGLSAFSPPSPSRSPRGRASRAHPLAGVSPRSPLRSLHQPLELWGPDRDHSHGRGRRVRSGLRGPRSLGFVLPRPVRSITTVLARSSSAAAELSTSRTSRLRLASWTSAGRKAALSPTSTTKAGLAGRAFRARSCLSLLIGLETDGGVDRRRLAGSV
jgi:hypothetical protein